MNFIELNHEGLPIYIDPTTGKEVARDSSHSLIELYPEKPEYKLEAKKRGRRGRSFAPPNSQKLISGRFHDYYIVWHFQ